MFYVWCCMLCCRCFDKSVSSFFVATRKKCDLPMQASKEKEVELKTVWDLRCTAKIVRNRWRNWTTTSTPKTNNMWILGGFCRGFTQISMFSPFCSMIFQNLTLHVENAFEFLRMKFFQATKAEKTNELTTKKIDLKDAEKAGKHYQTAWKFRNFGMADI